MHMTKKTHDSGLETYEVVSGSVAELVAFLDIVNKPVRLAKGELRVDLPFPGDRFAFATGLIMGAELTTEVMIKLQGN